MNAKEIKKEINEYFGEKLKFYNYKKKGDRNFILEHKLGFNQIEFDFVTYGKNYEASILISRRYNIIEEIIAPYIQEINLNYRNNGKDITMRFSENNLDDIHTGARYYKIPNGNYQKAFKQMEYALFNRLLPFLEKLNSLENLHNFINEPVKMLMPNSSFFYNDILLYKPAIAKLVNIDYEKTCDFCHKFILNEMKKEDEEYANKLNNAFIQLKQKLDTM